MSVLGFTAGTASADIPGAAPIDVSYNCPKNISTTCYRWIRANGHAVQGPLSIWQGEQALRGVTCSHANWVAALGEWDWGHVDGVASDLYEGTWVPFCHTTGQPFGAPWDVKNTYGDN